MTACEHAKSGLVTSRPLGGIEHEYAAAPVCDREDCIAEALAWVSARVHGRPAFYVAGEVTAVTHARLGRLAVWTCKGCTTSWFQGRFPCRECCGYTTSNEKVVRGVLTVYGQRNARCVP